MEEMINVGPIPGTGVQVYLNMWNKSSAEIHHFFSTAGAATDSLCVEAVMFGERVKAEFGCDQEAVFEQHQAENIPVILEGLLRQVTRYSV